MKSTYERYPLAYLVVRHLQAFRGLRCEPSTSGSGRFRASPGRCPANGRGRLPLLLPFAPFLELGALALKVRAESFDVGGPSFMLRPFSLAEPLPVLGGSFVAAGGAFMCPCAVPVALRSVGRHGTRAYRQGASRRSGVSGVLRCKTGQWARSGGGRRCLRCRVVGAAPDRRVGRRLQMRRRSNEALRLLATKVQFALGVVRGFLEAIRHLLNEAYEFLRLWSTKEAGVHIADVTAGFSNLSPHARNVVRVHRGSLPYLCDPSPIRDRKGEANRPGRPTYLRARTYGAAV